METGVEQLKKIFYEYPNFTGGDDANKYARLVVLMYSDRLGYSNAIVIPSVKTNLVNKINQLWDLKVPNVYGEEQQGGFFGTNNHWIQALSHYQFIYDKLALIEENTIPPCP